VGCTTGVRPRPRLPGGLAPKPVSLAEGLMHRGDFGRRPGPAKTLVAHGGPCVVAGALARGAMPCAAPVPATAGHGGCQSTPGFCDRQSSKQEHHWCVRLFCVFSPPTLRLSLVPACSGGVGSDSLPLASWRQAPGAQAQQLSILCIALGGVTEGWQGGPGCRVSRASDWGGWWG
jgi:hypothetical protein